MFNPFKRKPKPPPEIRIVLDDQDFKKLISGKQLQYSTGVKIILTDIGYTKMFELLVEASSETR